MVLETDRLILRPWRDDDAEGLYKIASDPDVGPAAGWPVHESVDYSRAIIRTVFNGPEVYAICLKGFEQDVIGSVGLKKQDSGVGMELGYWIGKPYWNQGYTTEASRELIRHAFSDNNLDVIWCGYFDENERSHSVMKKLGFEFHHGHMCDVSLLGEMRHENVMLLTQDMWRRNFG